MSLTPAEFEELRDDHETFCHRRLEKHRHKGRRHHRHPRGLLFRHDEAAADPGEVAALDATDRGGWHVGGFERPF